MPSLPNGRRKNDPDWVALMFQVTGIFWKEYAKQAAKTLASRPVVMTMLGMAFYCFKIAAIIIASFVSRLLK